MFSSFILDSMYTKMKTAQQPQYALSGSNNAYGYRIFNINVTLRTISFSWLHMLPWSASLPQDIYLIKWKMMSWAEFSSCSMTDVDSTGMWLNAENLQSNNSKCLVQPTCNHVVHDHSLQQCKQLITHQFFRSTCVNSIMRDDRCKILSDHILFLRQTRRMTH